MTYVLTVLLLIPFVGFIVTWAAGVNQRIAKWVALAFSVAQLALLTLIFVSYWMPWPELLLGPRLSSPTGGIPGWTGEPFSYYERADWVPQWGMNYILGFDGLSLPLAWLTPLLTTLAIIFHWDEERRPREFFALLLFLEMSLTGVFMALDFFLFFIFWELVLIPMFFLIGIWGGPNRRYAALKFFVYTHVASVIMLLSIFALYWTYSSQANLVVYNNPANTFDMTAFLEAARRHAVGGVPPAHRGERQGHAGGMERRGDLAAPERAAPAVVVGPGQGQGHARPPHTIQRREHREGLARDHGGILEPAVDQVAVDHQVASDVGHRLQEPEERAGRLPGAGAQVRVGDHDRGIGEHARSIL